MKELKDYLHLYLGCECKWKVMGETEWNVPDSRIDLKILDRIYDRQPFVIVPILRPLSDLTEDEIKEYHYIGKQSNYMETSAMRTLYLLSLRVDLFGLIESGLAIDKTTLTP